jgi:FkbM family methyltransferase
VYAGERLRVIIADAEGAEWYDRDMGRLPELDLLRRNRLRPSARVFDLGAHQGVIAILLGRSVGDHGRVVAVEPNQFNVDLIARNAALNGVRNVEVVRAAVGRRSGFARMGHQLNDRLRLTDEPGGYRVPAVTIDALTSAWGPPDVIVLDIEGFEVAALEGAHDTLLSQRADWFIEAHVGVGLETAGGSVDALLRNFPESSFDLFTAVAPAGDFRPLGERPEVMTRRFNLIAIDRRPDPSR